MKADRILTVDDSGQPALWFLGDDRTGAGQLADKFKTDRGSFRRPLPQRCGAADEGSQGREKHKGDEYFFHADLLIDSGRSWGRCVRDLRTDRHVRLTDRPRGGLSAAAGSAGLSYG